MTTTVTAPFIVSLGIDQDSFAILDGLRQQHFPPERNFLRAHITLFHALPGDGESEAAVRAVLRDTCADYEPFPVVFSGLRSLGRGVAVTIDSPELLRLRSALSRKFAPWLTPQDQQKFHPHVTIQNKVTPEAAKELLTRLSPTWKPWSGEAQSLVLWRYKNGPWEHADTFAFGIRTT